MKAMTCFALMGLMAASVTAEPLLKQANVPEKSKGWLDSFEKAKTEAAANKQPIFAFFTGSDWCGWCVKLKKEVLDTKGFEDFAAGNLVLFEADFPRAKPLSDEVKKQNAELAAKYGVRGYPSVFLLDAEGKVLGKTGYQQGGEKVYIEHLRKLLNDAGVTSAEKPAAQKGMSAFEKLKAEKAQAEAAAGAAAKPE